MADLNLPTTLTATTNAPQNPSITVPVSWGSVPVYEGFAGEHIFTAAPHITYGMAGGAQPPVITVTVTPLGITPLTTRTTPLAPTSGLSDSNAAEGWAWDHTTLTLTLSGVDINVAAGPAIDLPGSSTIILVGSSNTVTNTAAGGGVITRGINAGPLTISGSGSLEVNTSGGSSGISAFGLTITGGAAITVNPAGYALSAHDDIVISNSSLLANGEIFTMVGDIIIHNSNITIVSGDTGLNASDGNVAITNSTVDINAAHNGISGLNGVTITGGNVTVDANFHGIDTGNGNVNISGGAEVAITAGGGAWRGINAAGNVSVSGAGTVLRATDGVDAILGTFSVTGGAALVVYTSAQLTQALADIGASTGTIHLRASFTHGQLTTLPAGADITLTSDSTVRTITRGVAGNFFHIQAGASLILEDIIIDGGRTGAFSAGGGTLVHASGSFYMNDGAVLRNNATANGGGVAVDSGGVFTMAGGEIYGNQASDGGGVHVHGTFNMTGGTIRDNTATEGGGVVIGWIGIFNFSGGTLSNNTATFGGGVSVLTGDFVMTGGNISNNTGGVGGGVDSGAAGDVTISGGTISGNNSPLGAGLSIGGFAGSFTLGGTAVITNNPPTGQANNLRLANNRFITLATGPNAPTTGMSVGVSTQTPSGVIVGSNATAEHVQFFSSDDPSLGVIHDSGQLRLGEVPPAITSQPANRSVQAGNNTTFTVIATGAPLPTFQWQVNSGSSWSNIAGATSHTLALSSVTQSMSGNQYRVVVSNSQGAVTSNAATLTVTAAGGTWTDSDTDTDSYTPAQSLSPGSQPSPPPAATTAPAIPYMWVELSQGLEGALEALLGDDFAGLEINIDTMAPAAQAGFVVADISLAVSNVAVNRTLQAQLPGILQVPEAYYTIFADLSGAIPPGMNYHRIVAFYGGEIIGGGIGSGDMIFSVDTSYTGSFAVYYVASLRRLVLALDSFAIVDLAGNAQTRTMDIRPVIRDNRTFVPIRFIAEALGATVDWTSAAAGTPLTVHLTLDGQTLDIPIGEITPVLTALGMDVPAQIMNGRTMVPLRFIAEFFGAVVAWDGDVGGIEVVWGLAREGDNFVD